MGTNPLDNLRRDLQARRKQLSDMSKQFDILSGQDPEEKMVKKTLSQYALLMEILYSHIEKLSIANFALKEQIEILRDVIQSLPDVKDNLVMQTDIDLAFKREDTSF